jgi:putative chitinase
MVSAHDIVTRFAPKAVATYVRAFADREGLLARAGVTTPLRLTHFMAQALHETAALTLKVESGAYSARALARMWDSGNWHRYFASRADCVAMAAQCRIDGGVALFTLVYGNRMGNGAPDTLDGWTYRGRGILQTTGRAAYRRFGERCGVAFEDDPDLVTSAEHALKPALAEWSDKGCNAAADRNDVALVTRLINGGSVGLEERRQWFARLWPFVVGKPPAAGSQAWKVQAALVRRGYDCGNPDGVIGSRTRTAILAFRKAQGLPVTAAITPDLLLALGVR